MLEGIHHECGESPTTAISRLTWREHASNGPRYAPRWPGTTLVRFVVISACVRVCQCAGKNCLGILEVPDSLADVKLLRMSRVNHKSRMPLRCQL
jgi:hypothetical protein